MSRPAPKRRRLDATRRTVGYIRREVFDRPGTGLATLVFLPGWSLRVGLRTILGRLVGVRVEHRHLSTTFGGYAVLRGDPGPWRTAAILVGVPALLIVLGFVAALPAMIEVTSLGSWTGDLSTGSEEGVALSLMTVLLIDGVWVAIPAWVAVSCWYAAAIPYEELAETRQRLGSSGTGVPGAVVRAILAPFALVGRVLGFGEWFGAVAAGMISLVAAGFASLAVTRLLFGL